MRKKVLIWESAGFLFILTAGTLLHFAYAWLDHWQPAALFAAVNESEWEHLKLGFWSALLFSLIEYAFIGRYGIPQVFR